MSLVEHAALDTSVHLIETQVNRALNLWVLERDVILACRVGLINKALVTNGDPSTRSFALLFSTPKTSRSFVNCCTEPVESIL